jgi:hypothetical protein
LRDKALVDRAMGVDQTIDQAKNTTSGRFMDLTARWNDLLMELGVIVLPTVIKGTEWLIDTLKGVKAFVKDFPQLTKGIVIAFGVLSGLVMAGGVVMLAAGAFGALGLAMTAGGGLPGMLTQTADSLKTFGRVVGWVGGAVAAWQAGQYVGNVINDNLSGGTKDMIGRTIAHMLAAVGVKDAQDAIDAESRYIRSQKQALATINNKIVLPNGKVLAEVVTKEQSKDAAKPQAGTSRFDGRMTPAHVGASGSW